MTIGAGAGGGGAGIDAGGGGMLTGGGGGGIDCAGGGGGGSAAGGIKTGLRRSSMSPAEERASAISRSPETRLIISLNLCGCRISISLFL